jgi:DNA invertase Pin-like site-specific DNA recombinase
MLYQLVTTVSVWYSLPNEVRTMGKKASYIAYFRVSTQQQGQSGLGLDAQRDSVRRFLASQRAHADQPVAEYTEIESGKRSKNRPQLLAALAECKRLKAVLVVAKMDRLARNVHFISGLMESKVAFIAVDMPEANELTVHIMSAMAEHEAKMIGQRTRAALEAAKVRGTKLGNPRWNESIEAARKAKVALVPAPAVLKMMQKHRDKGLTLRTIADELNALGLRTPKGSAWYASTVGRALATA